MPESTQTRDLTPFYTPAAIVIAGVIIGVSIILAFGGSGGLGNAGGPQPQKVDIADVSTEGEPFIGEENAPVTLAYWYDYQCPFCKAVDVGGVPQIPVEPAMPILIKDYVNTGKLKIVFKDYAFLGPDSTTAAKYSGAMWELYPEKWHEWHEAMFKAQDEEHGGFGNEASILTLTRKIAGVDANRVKALVAQKGAEYEAEAAADQQEGSSFGISGTPGFITGTVMIPGADDPQTFISAIDAQL